jgi:hypothetical protein
VLVLSLTFLSGQQGEDCDMDSVIQSLKELHGSICMEGDICMEGAHGAFFAALLLAQFVTRFVILSHHRDLLIQTLIQIVVSLACHALLEESVERAPQTS